MRKMIVDPAVMEKFPDLNLGLIVGRNLDNSGSEPEIREMVLNEQANIRKNFALETLSSHPRIQSWRRAYSSFGAKPKKYRSSVESLYRLTLKGSDLKSINPLVDLYNYFSLKYMVPLGGDDLEKVEGHIRLIPAAGQETFVPLNSSAPEHPKPGEIIYSDDRDVLCRRWNWRESNKTKMTAASRHVLLVAEGLSPVEKEEIKLIGDELCGSLRKYCGGEYRTFVLNRSLREIEF